MGYSKKTTKAAAPAEENEKDIFDLSEVEIKRAHLVNDNLVMFDMIVRGITIYGMAMRHYKTKEGKEGDMISFPSKKAANDNYYDCCWFPISKELREGIIRKVISILG